MMADVLTRCLLSLQEENDAQCCNLTVVALTSRDQFVEEQQSDTTFGKIYRCLEESDNVSIIQANICANWSQDFQLIDCLLLYSKNLNFI